MRKLEFTIRGLLLRDGLRPAGESIIDGKKVVWNDAYTISLLPLGDERGEVRKLNVSPECVNNVEKLLADANWGTVIDLETNGKLVTEVNIVLDWADSLSI